MATLINHAVILLSLCCVKILILVKVVELNYSITK